VLQAPSFFVQDRGVIARRNQLGTFQVKNELKTETSTKFPKTKTTKIRLRAPTCLGLPTHGALSQFGFSTAFLFGFALLGKVTYRV
jgi:hypothetical protein